MGSLVVSAVASFVIIQPLSELTTYASSARAAQIQSCLDVIPPDASVAATSRLVPHLSERRQIYDFPDGTSSQYLAIDLTTNGPLSPAYAEFLRNLLRTSLSNGYHVACSKGPTAVLERGPGARTLSPPMARFLAR